MKKLVAYLLLFMAAIVVNAQSKSDSLAYQLQRKKINNMLAQRRQQFGQYSESLSKHTGIFGLQTKKDIRRSNDILMDIVKTDNDIFGQLKILLDYRAFEQTQVQSHSSEIENSTLGYMTTINKLRDQLDAVNKEAGQQQKSQEHLKKILFIIIGFMLVSILLLISQKRKAKV